MNTVTAGIAVSPVNMENRKELGIKPGDTVRVHQKITDDKGKTRIQMFEGLVLARKHGNEPGATFTVRRVIDGIGVEKIFPLYSPMIDKIEIIRRSKVRRAKLYYIREKVAREIKRQMRRMRMMDLASESDIEAAARAEEEKQKAEEAEESEAQQAEEAQATDANDSNEAPAEETANEAVEEKTEEQTQDNAAEAKEEKPEEAPAEESQEEEKQEETETDEDKKKE